MATRSPLSNTARRSTRSGFALLIVLSLLGLIVIILISLAAFTRVETNVATSAQFEAQARQNAMTALNLAVGQLQREAGPDKRVTATSSLVGATNVQNPNWTGVWDSAGNFQSWLVNPANGNGNVTTAALPTSTKDPVTANTNGTNGTNGVVQLVGTGPDDTATPSDIIPDANSINRDGTVVRSPAAGEPGNGNATSQFINLKLDNIDVAGLPGFGAADYRTIGRIAWWTSDDGVKASLSGSTRVDEVNYDDADVAGEDYAGTLVSQEGYVKRERLAALNLQAPRIDLALRNFSGTDAVTTQLNADIYGAMLDPASRTYVKRVESIRQYAGAVRAVGNANTSYTISGLNPNTTRDNYRQLDYRLRERFHDITPATYSVISDVVSGGLKTDFDAFTSTTLPANQAQIGVFKDATTRISPEGASARGILQSRITLADLVPPPNGYIDSSPTIPNPPEPVAVIGPVLSECRFSITFTQSASGEVTATFGGNIELWNPYNAVMEMPNSANDRWILRVLIGTIAGEKFSDIELSDDVKTTPSDFNIAQTLGFSDTSLGATYDFLIDLAATAADAELPPGRARTFAITPVSLPALDSGGNPLIGFDTAASTVIVRSKGTSQLTAFLVRNRPAPDNDQDFFGISDVTFALTAVAAPVGGVAYHFRVNDAKDYTTGNSWLQRFDPRGPMIVSATSDGVTTSLGSDPADAFINFSFDSDVEFIKSVTSPGGVPLIIADLPRQQITSVGYLQQMPFTPASTTTNSPAYRIGTANGTNFNALFDSHYFSTIPKGVTTWDPSAASVRALPNTSLVPVSRLSGSPALADLQGTNIDTARYFLARDTLNVNSTSVTAWRSVLGGTLPGFTLVWNGTGPVIERKLLATWRHTVTPGLLASGGNVTSEDIGNVFFRLPHTGQDLRAALTSELADITSSTSNVRVPASYRLGLRTLSNAEVNTLAERLVARIALRTGPFRSLRDFINSGVLQGAINDANLNGTGGSALETYAPAFLTQGDILQAIGHRLVARSDTFTIRAYGEAGTPALDNTDVDFVKGRAWLEATVQRMPMKKRKVFATDPAATLDENNDMTDTGDTAGTHLGREFRIISFRWLTPNDL